MTGRIGVKKDGTITALQLKVIGNSGPYLSQCVKTTKVTLVMFGSLYRCPNVYGEGYSIYTNTVNSGGHRGYGAPQAYYVLEQLVDMACEKIGMDPLEFRLQNHRRVGDPSMYSFVSKDEKLGIETRKPMPIESCQLPECIKRGAEQIGWKEKRMAKKEGTIRRGVGMACYIYLSSAFPVDFQHSSVFIKFNEDGSANLVVSACDFGQGILASLAQIAAEELGLRAEDIRITSGNTDITMYDTGQYSSRSCYIIGNSVLGAARLAKQRLLERAAQIIGEPADKLDIKDRQVYVKTAPEKRIPVAEVTWQAMYDADNFSNISAKYAWQPTSNAYPFQAAFAEVEVDTESGQVKLLKIVTGQDIGRAINPITAEGQVQGGGIQAIDMALYSDFVTKPTGELESTNFTNYKVSTTMDIPEFEVILIEEPTPTGPFGAKSVGESGTIAIAPAIYNAIYDAVGVRVKDMPVTPEKIIEGLLALVDQDTG
jgi:xanthine dehydrogenase molybdenum-binding subunit